MKFRPRPITSDGLTALALGWHEWPVWVVVAMFFRAEKDRGLGDTIRREIGPAKSAAFKRFHEAMFGVWLAPCGCAGQLAKWNALYPYQDRVGRR